MRSNFSLNSVNSYKQYYIGVIKSYDRITTNILTRLMYGYTYSQSMDQPGKVASPARGQLNRETMNISLSAFVPENLVSRDGFGSPVPRQPAHLHTQAESGAYIPYLCHSTST